MLHRDGLGKIAPHIIFVAFSLANICCTLAFDAFRLELPNTTPSIRIKTCAPRTIPGPGEAPFHAENCQHPIGLGHVSSVGGGMLNDFGIAFKRDNFWSQRLCQADSDGDGYTNGHELGDPCCCWSVGLVPSRTVFISHPGDSESVPGVYDLALAAKWGLNITDAGTVGDLDMCDCPQAGDKQAEEGSLFQLHTLRETFLGSTENVAKVTITAILVGLMAYILRLGVFGTMLANGPVWTVAMALASMLYMDMTSGFVHLVLDNPANLEVPPLNAGTRSFLNHHKDPQSIVRENILKYFCTHHLIVLVFVALSWKGVKTSPSARVLAFMALISSQVMQMAHRWAHASPNTLPLVVQWLQQSGVLIDQRYHSRHHIPPHEENFCIMMGWTDHFINYATKYILSPKSRLWDFVLLAWLFVPSLLLKTAKIYMGGSLADWRRPQTPQSMARQVALARWLGSGALACITLGTLVHFGSRGAWAHAFHPIVMSFATIYCMVEGVVYRFLPGFRKTIPHRERIMPHKRMQQAAGVLTMVGVGHAIFSKWSMGLSAIPQSPHAVIGTVAFGGILLQVLTGVAKYTRLIHSNERTLRWHGNLGWCVFGTCLLSVVVGLSQLRSDSIFSYLGIYFVCGCGVVVFRLREARQNCTTDIGYKDHQSL